MAQSARDIKRRVKSIQSTMQITRAMELVSSAKLMKARERLAKARPYYKTVYKNIQETLNTIGQVNHPLLRRREIQRSLYIIISDDRGLAGGYNNNIVRLVEAEIERMKEKVDLILVGTKAIDYFDSKGYHIREELIGITEDPQFSDAQHIGNLAFELYKNNEVDQIKIFYTKFLNNITQEPQIRQLLPYVEDGQMEQGMGSRAIDFEPSPEEVLDYLIPKYITSCIYGSLMEASCSEQGARRAAMGIATENAREMIEELKISYNRVRQSAITTEISEITAGTQTLR